MFIVIFFTFFLNIFFFKKKNFFKKNFYYNYFYIIKNLNFKKNYTLNLLNFNKIKIFKYHTLKRDDYIYITINNFFFNKNLNKFKFFRISELNILNW